MCRGGSDAAPSGQAVCDAGWQPNAQVQLRAPSRWARSFSLCDEVGGRTTMMLPTRPSAAAPRYTSGRGDLEVAADLARQEVIDLAVARDGRDLAGRAVHVDRVAAA